MSKGATTAKGLGWEHQQLRAALLPYAYGQPCPRCKEPMLPGQPLDLGHAWDRATYGPHNPGPRRIEHASCNRRSGQALAVTRRMRRNANTTSPRSRNW